MKEAFKQTDRAEVQCYDAKRGLYRLVQPDALPDRLFQSKVADVFRGDCRSTWCARCWSALARTTCRSWKSQPAMWVDTSARKARSSDTRDAATPRAGFWDRHGLEQPTKSLPYICPNPRCGNRFAQAMRTKCILCHREVLPLKESAYVLRSPAADGSSYNFRHGQSPTRTTTASSRGLERTYWPPVCGTSTLSSTSPRRRRRLMRSRTLRTRLQSGQFSPSWGLRFAISTCS